MSSQESIPNVLSRALAPWAPPIRAVLAVSGGADSIALLHAWKAIQADRGDTLVVATFDHGLRPESGEDARFVSTVSADLGLECVVGGPTTPLRERKNRSLEEAARDARYAFLVDVAQRAGAEFVATAHHADDQVETVLHRLIRGTGLVGMCGMAAHRRLAEGIVLVRPFLSITRARLRDYLVDQGATYRDDATNADLALTRNRVRSVLLPLLREEFNPRVDEAILRLADLASLAMAREKHEVEELRALVVRSETPDAIELDASQLSAAPRHLAGMLLRRLISGRKWPLKRLGRSSIEAALSAADEHGPQAVSLPGWIEARRVGASLRLSRNPGARSPRPAASRC